MERVRDLGLDRRVSILAGVAPLRSARSARYMQERVPGMEVTDAIIRRMDQAGPDRGRAEEEGLSIAVEIVEQIREIKGLAGIHLMPIHWEEAVSEIAARARLTPARSALATPVAARAGQDAGPDRRGRGVEDSPLGRPREHRA
jgi:methylenetetrahydrofolate reductase (NADPH)